MSTKGEDIKASRIKQILALEKTSFVRFRGTVMVESARIEGHDGIGDLEGTRGFVPLRSDWFAHFIYLTIGVGTGKAAIMDYQHAIEATAPDWTRYDHLIGMGMGPVWDMNKLEFVSADKYVYKTDIEPQPAGSPGYEAAKAFLLQLSMGDSRLAYDYRQAIAPLYMKTRPAGIIWFMGNGANGKSTLLNTLYAAFRPYLKSVNTAQLEDGKIIPTLAGVLGNIVQEASEARIEDAGNYKLLGTRQDLEVRRMFTQDVITVSTDFHTIFNANNIPTFADKTIAIRRRTLVVPFPAHFKDDPGFDARTLTPELIGGMITLCLEAAVEIRERGNEYDWSPTTVELKKQYDESVNSAEAFAFHLKEKKIQGFYNWGVLFRNYQYWCNQESFQEMFRPGFKRTIINEFAPYKRTAVIDGHTRSCMLFEGAPNDLVWLEPSGYAMADEKEPTQLELEETEERQW